MKTLYFGLFIAALTLEAQPHKAHQQRVREPLMNTVHRAVPDPSTLVRDVSSQDAATRVSALEAVGVPVGFRPMPTAQNPSDHMRVVEARLLYTNLDADPDLEAIIVLQQLNYAFAAVFNHRRSGWQRVAFLSCWCKYESDPLARFVEIRSLIDPGRNEIIVRDSLGGTGAYWRDVVVYRFVGDDLREVLRIPEERRDCHPTEPQKRYCSVERAFLSNARDPHFQAVVVSVVRGEIRKPSPQPETKPGPPEWYPPLADNLHRPTPTSCRAFAWDARRQVFGRDDKVWLLYCQK